MRARRRGCTLSIACVACAVAFSPTLARAEPSEADKLFDEGASLMKQGKFGDACPKFEQSNKLDPEIGGLLWLADCYERNNQSASAYRTYKDAQKMALDRKDKQQRDKVAQKHMTTLEPHLTKLTILGPAGDVHIDGLKITRDGELLGPSDLGLAIPVDAGSHIVAAMAPNYKRWEKTLDVQGEGNTATVTVGPLEKSDAGAPPPVVDDSDPGFAMHVGGVIVGAAGLVSIGVGSVLGLVAAGKLSDSNADGHCVDNQCDTIGLQLRSDAKDAALVSTILFVAGGVGVAGGIALFFLAPKKKHAQVIGLDWQRIAPIVGNGIVGASIGGTF
jgi:serine/threonine-protein kinase